MSVASALPSRLAATWRSAHDWFAPARPYAAALAGRVRPVTDVVTPLGWSVLLFGFGCWVLGWRFGWSELMVMGTAAWVLLGISALMTIGRSRLDVSLVADPQRVVVGAPAAGAVRVVNSSRRPLLSIGLDVPIGMSSVAFSLPTLAPGAEHEELFVVPTQRRGVVTVGPAATVRGDPLGMLRRTAPWTDSLEIFVHPITVYLESLGAGFLRDLEGQPTNDLSASDLAFHALREYQPGDDRRHIHWKSSAKLGKFMVRQFLDTRRSHVALVVDSERGSYADADDYELAISAAASLTLRTFRDQQQATVLAGEHAAPDAEAGRVLDVFSRAELADRKLLDLARRANRIAPDLSLAVLVTGSELSLRELRHAAAEFPIDVRVLAIQVDPSRPSGLREAGGMTVLSLQRLGDLAAVMMGAAA